MRVAEKLNPDTAALGAGVVERCEGSTAVVRSQGRLHRALRAPSCILAPEPGDRVLVAHTGEGRAFVLAVLERDEDAPHRWTADGAVSIESPDQVSISSASVSVKSRFARLAIGAVHLVGKEVLAEVAKSKIVAQSIEQVANVVQQTASRLSRVVTEIEHVRAGTVDMAASKSLMIHAENAMVTAKALVKMDGEAVQLG